MSSHGSEPIKGEAYDLEAALQGGSALSRQISVRRFFFNPLKAPRLSKLSHVSYLRSNSPLNNSSDSTLLLGVKWLKEI